MSFIKSMLIGDSPGNAKVEINWTNSAVASRFLRGRELASCQLHPCNLTVRLSEDMRIRNLAHGTIDAYTFHAARFADFIQKPLDSATVEDVRNFQLYLIDNRKLAYSSFNQAVCALRFLYTHTIRLPWLVTMVPFSKRPKTLPIVLGRQEVTELLRCTKNLKQRTFITTLYATGMRFSEAANLKLADIDTQRMQIRITHGKGSKQRQVPLSPRLLNELRVYWKQSNLRRCAFRAKRPTRLMPTPRFSW